MTIRAAAVVLAGGSGSRVGASTNKVLLDLDGVSVLARAVRTVLDVETVQRVVLVCRAAERDAVRDAVAPHLGAHDLWVVDGGTQRHDSEWAALRVLAPEIDAGEIDVVAIHDGARPLATPELWRAVVDAAAEQGGAIPVLASPPLSRRDGTLAPRGLVSVQTPQAFRAVELLAAYRSADAEGFTGTDTASCVARYADVPIAAVEGERANLKVTFAEDVALATELVTPRRGPASG